MQQFTMDDTTAAMDIWKRPRPVRLELEKLARGTINQASDRRHGERTFRVLVGAGRDCVLHSAELPITLIPLRGRVKLTEGDSTRLLHAGQLFVGDGGQRVQIIGGGDSLWMALAAPPGAWRQFVDVISEQTIPAPVLLPATHVADRTIVRAAVRLAREARDHASSERSEGAVLRFVALLLDLQSMFDPLIARCPGRTLGQRRGVFLRLQRVCNYMESNSDLDLGIAGFARVANYSPCHFLRTFNTVYGKTPHAVLIEQRLKRALRLVNDTALSITEVAHASGFEDRCAFSRSFKRRYGETASAVRERRLASVALCE
jgi:AraC family transcriptional regulator